LTYAAIQALVTFVFFVLVYGQYRRRRRIHQFFWTVSLAFAWVGTGAYLVAATADSAAWFRLYYIFGALLVAPFMGLGSAFFGMSERVARASLWPVVAVSAVGAVGVTAAPLDQARLAALAGESGVGVLRLPWWALVAFILVNTYGTVAVVWVALASAVNLLRRRASGPFAAASGLIAIGILLLAFAGTMARLGAGGFWLTMALGWAVAFGGFLLTFRGADRASPRTDTAVRPG